MTPSIPGSLPMYLHCHYPDHIMDSAVQEVTLDSRQRSPSTSAHRVAKGIALSDANHSQRPVFEYQVKFKQATRSPREERNTERSNSKARKSLPAPTAVHDAISLTGQALLALPDCPKEKRTPVISINSHRTCTCPQNHLNCLTAKEWIKNQLGVWQFTYNGRDVRDKRLHPATFPIALAKRVIELFTHKGELVLDPFVGSGTTLVAAQEVNRNAVGFDLSETYVALARNRLGLNLGDGNAIQLAVQDDARNIPKYFDSGVTARLVLTSPPYANLLNRMRLNKSRRDRKNDQYLKVEQYSQDPRDLGTLCLDDYAREMESIFRNLLPVLEPGAHCVINVPDMWWNDSRVTIHSSVIEALRHAGYEFRNTIIWDRTNIVNKVGIFGWPRNYITMGTTFEYILDFRKPPTRKAEVAPTLPATPND
jgi:DNA modification methylase